MGASLLMLFNGPTPAMYRVIFGSLMCIVIFSLGLLPSPMPGPGLCRTVRRGHNNERDMTPLTFCKLKDLGDPAVEVEDILSYFRIDANSQSTLHWKLAE